MVLLAGTIVMVAGSAWAQTDADSVTITFRTYQPPGNNVFVPGEFNGWGPNTNGVISAGAPSQMSYDGGLGAYVKTYTFKIKDPADVQRTFADSVWLYKFNAGGTQNDWYGDPLNPETDGSPFSNSVLRMTDLFWYQYYPTISSDQITRITIGLIHANSDSITSVQLSTGISEDDPLTTVDITADYDRPMRIIDHVLSGPISKLDYVRLVAHNNLGDSVVFERGGIIVSSQPLPAYAKHGVTLPGPASGDSATFRLRVPQRSYVLLRIAPAGQDPALATPVTMRDGGADNWWINLKLSAGTYEYLYEFEDGTKVYDPWGRWNGAKGSRFTVGAAGLTADDYAWRSTSYERPPLNKIVIYELNIGEFTGGFFGLGPGQGTFDHLTSLLTHFDSLGVNAIELMPVNDYGIVGASGFSWGYDLNSYFALEPSYGTPRDFKELVDSAHALGIAVIVDVVFNHINDTSPLWQMLPQEYANPYFKLCPDDLRYNEDGLCFFKDINHWVPQTQELVYEAIKMWIDEYRVDGFRYDYTQGIGWHKDSTDSGILGWVNRIDQEYGGTVYQIAEHLPESPALVYHSGLTGGWHDSFHDEILYKEAYDFTSTLTNIQNYVVGRGAYGGNDTPATPSSYAGRTEPVNMTVNHDELSLIYQMTVYSPFSYPDSVIMQRDKLYGTLMFTSLGIPMLWQGVEMSAPRGWLSGGERLSYRPLEVSYLSQQRGRDHFNYYSKLAWQRRKNPALTDGTLRILKQDPSSKSMVWGFEDVATGSKVMVLANFLWSDANLTDVPWLASGTWYDVFDQSTFEVTDTTIAAFPLPSFTARVFSNRSDLDLGIVTSVIEETPAAPLTYALAQNYPNPFNPSTTIRYSLAHDDNVIMKVYNILGEEIATLVNGFRSKGTYSVRWDGTSTGGTPAGSGLYFVRLQTSGFAETRKMLLLR